MSRKNIKKQLKTINIIDDTQNQEGQISIKKKQKKNIDLEILDNENQNELVDPDDVDIIETSENFDKDSTESIEEEPDEAIEEEPEDDVVDDPADDEEDDVGAEVEVEGDIAIEGDQEEKEKKDVYDDEGCLYKYAEGELEDDIELTFDDDAIEEVSDIVPNSQRITKAILTKYERVRILGDRIQQLTLGAKPMIKNTGHLSVKEIAFLELTENKIPLIILRPLPNGKKEQWYIHELKHQ